MCNVANSSMSSRNLLISRSSSNNFQCLRLLGMEGLYFTYTSYLSLGSRGTPKLLAEMDRDSSMMFSPLGINEMLKAKTVDEVPDFISIILELRVFGLINISDLLDDQLSITKQ